LFVILVLCLFERNQGKLICYREQLSVVGCRQARLIAFSGRSFAATATTTRVFRKPWLLAHIDDRREVVAVRYFLSQPVDCESTPAARVVLGSLRRFISPRLLDDPSLSSSNPDYRSVYFGESKSSESDSDYDCVSERDVSARFLPAPIQGGRSGRGRRLLLAALMISPTSANFRIILSGLYV